MLKSLIAGGGLLLGGAYMMGAIGGTGYSRTVDRPPVEVLAALMDMDIRDQPGSPGTDPARAGGITPSFRASHADGWIRWDVMSGDRIATTMWAELVPLDGGRRTRVTAHVERGDAPDDVVSPAFRSTGITMGLFSMALEDELSDLTRPAGGDPARCQEIMEAFADSAIPADGEPIAHRPTNMKEALGGYGRASMKVAAVQQRMRAAGCDTSAREPFGEVSSRMRPATGDDAPRERGVNFTPGQPMVDPNPGGQSR